MPTPADSRRFDADYYRRFYGRRDTRVSEPTAIARLAAFVIGYMLHLDMPLRSVLDLGCGLGHWRRAISRLAPKARYHGVEFSDYLCRRHGWTQGSVVDFATTRRHDLVVCQGVLQYLDDDDAVRAIDNLGQLAPGALYVEALTARDWRENCDRSVTDGDVNLRTGAWYRRRLHRHFVPLGGGLFANRRAGIVTFELETLA